MNAALSGLIDWLTVGPLKNFRTQILSTLIFALSGSYALDLFQIKAHLSTDRFVELLALLNAAAHLTSSTHDVTPPTMTPTTTPAPNKA